MKHSEATHHQDRFLGTEILKAHVFIGQLWQQQFAANSIDFFLIVGLITFWWREDAAGVRDTLW